MSVLRRCRSFPGFTALPENRRSLILSGIASAPIPVANRQLSSASIQSLLATSGMAALIRDLKVVIAPLDNLGWLK
jgi:hypothetical protein